MKIDEFSKYLIERAVGGLDETTKNTVDEMQYQLVELMPEELVGTTCEAVLETGETIILEKEKGLDGKACWKGYKQMGTKKKGGKIVDNCVKAGYEPEGDVIKEKKDMPGNQEKIDANKNGKVDAHDFALLRAKKGKKSVKEMREISEAKIKTKIEIMPNISDDPTEQGEKQSSEISSDAKNSKYDSKKKKMKEEVEDLEEKKLSAAEVAKKEKVVKGMKKKFGSMKSKYGDKAQSVMYGAATNMAKKKA